MKKSNSAFLSNRARWKKPGVVFLSLMIYAPQLSANAVSADQAAGPVKLRNVDAIIEQAIADGNIPGAVCWSWGTTVIS
jgi:hypothetical protein